MKIKQIKFNNAVVIDGRSETFFTDDHQGLRGTKVEQDGNFLVFRPPTKNPPTMVPLQNVCYILLLSEEKTAGKKAPSKEAPVSVQSTK